MSESISSILQQIRSYQSQASERGTGLNLEPIASPASLDTAKPAPAGSSFTDTLRDAINGVNDAQKNAGNLAQAFELGDPRAGLASVMVAAQQSQVAFRATVEVRNRLVQAYQDILSMPV